jgi:L-aminopeptidase/D-esterase-like protein
MPQVLRQQGTYCTTCRYGYISPHCLATPHDKEGSRLCPGLTTGTIVDVPGILAASVEDSVAATGCTALLFPWRAVCGVDIRGSAPATKEIDLLAPTAWVEGIDGIVLSGGSTFGLDAAGGVVRYLEQRGLGLSVGSWKVPIVPAAALFDLDVGDGSIRPDRAMGYKAALKADASPLRMGNYGAGCGATVGKTGGLRYAMKGGLGSSSRALYDGLVVGAVVAVNAIGDVHDPATGEILAGCRDSTSSWATADLPPSNTTLAVVGVNASLTKSQATHVAKMAQDGFARAIAPSHTLRDGDVIFAVGTGSLSVDPDLVGAISAELVIEAIVGAVRHARAVGAIVAHADLCSRQDCYHGAHS